MRSPYEPQIESLEALLAKRELTTELLCDEAREFSEMDSTHGEPSLFGVTDGKAVGTYLEHKFQAALHHGYIYQEGSSCQGHRLPWARCGLEGDEPQAAPILLPIQIGPSEDLRARLLASRVRV